jgi:hypothetical protein
MEASFDGQTTCTSERLGEASDRRREVRTVRRGDAVVGPVIRQR